MPAKISLRDARLERMRGKVAEPLIPLQKEAHVEPVEPQPVPAAPVSIDTEPIAQAMTAQANMLSQAISQLKQEPGEPQPKKWTFRITQRDRAGNIVAFEAEAIE